MTFEINARASGRVCFGRGVRFAAVRVLAVKLVKTLPMQVSRTSRAQRCFDDSPCFIWMILDLCATHAHRSQEVLRRGSDDAKPVAARIVTRACVWRRDVRSVAVAD